MASCLGHIRDKGHSPDVHLAVLKELARQAGFTLVRKPGPGKKTRKSKSNGDLAGWRNLIRKGRLDTGEPGP